MNKILYVTPSNVQLPQGDYPIYIFSEKEIFILQSSCTFICLLVNYNDTTCYQHFFNLNLHFLLVERFTQSHGLEINMENAKQLKSLAFGNAVQMGKKTFIFHCQSGHAFHGYYESGHYETLTFKANVYT